MSDRLPISRRRTARGRHAATSAHRRPTLRAFLPHGGHARTRFGQGAVVAALVVGLGATVSHAAPGGTTPALFAASPTQQAVQEARADAVTVAGDAVVAAQATHQEGAAAAVDPATLAALDAATARLAELLEVAQAEPADARDAQAASRSADRAATPDRATPDRAAATDRDAADRAAATDRDAASATDHRVVVDKAVPPTPATSTPADPVAVPAPTAAVLPPAAAAPAVTPDSAAAVTPTSAVPEVPPSTGPEDSTTADLREAVAAVATLATQVRHTVEASRAAEAAAVAAQQAADQAAAQAAADAAAKDAQRAAWKASLRGYANGRIPASALCSVSFDASVLLRCDAAEALDALNVSYKAAFGTDLVVNDSYRSYGGQVTCRRTKGRLCATPGTSNHGTGVAVDLGGGIQSFGTPQHAWMVEHAGEQSWTHPGWAEPRGGKPEAWHWEYVG